MKLFLVVLSITTVVLATASLTNGKSISKASLNKAWHSFVKAYSKVYNSVDELNIRKEIFAANYQFISEQNEKYEQGIQQYTLGVNLFADLTNEEFRAKYLSLKEPLKDRIKRKINEASSWINFSDESLSSNHSNLTLNQTVDWRSVEPTVLNDIEDQGSCGSCWSFATLATLETAYAMTYGKLPKFSEQYLLDCDSSNDGCYGGWPTSAFEYVAKHGSPLEVDYPYLGYKNTKNNCSSKGYNSSNEFKFEYLESISDSDMRNLTENNGAILVAIDATPKFQFYKSGIFSDPLCKSVNHAVNLVGFFVGSESNSTSNDNYWIIRNSWGENWGEDGYFKLKMDEKACLIKKYVWYADYSQ